MLQMYCESSDVTAQFARVKFIADTSPDLRGISETEVARGPRI